MHIKIYDGNADLTDMFYRKTTWKLHTNFVLGSPNRFCGDNGWLLRISQDIQLKSFIRLKLAEIMLRINFLLEVKRKQKDFKYTRPQRLLYECDRMQRSENAKNYDGNNKIVHLLEHNSQRKIGNNILQITE